MIITSSKFPEWPGPKDGRGPYLLLDTVPRDRTRDVIKLGILKSKKEPKEGYGPFQIWNAPGELRTVGPKKIKKTYPTPIEEQMREKKWVKTIGWKTKGRTHEWGETRHCSAPPPNFHPDDWTQWVLVLME